MSNPSTGEGAASGAGRGRAQAVFGGNRGRLGTGWATIPAQTAGDWARCLI